MKSISFLFFIIMFFNSYLYSQKKQPTYNQEEAWKQKTLIVYNHHYLTPEENKTVKEAIENYWTISNFEFVDKEDSKKYQNNLNYPIFTYFDGRSFEKDLVNSFHFYIYEKLSMNKKGFPVIGGEEIASVAIPFESKGNSRRKKDYAYLLPLWLKIMQEKILSRDLPARKRTTIKKTNYLGEDTFESLKEKQILICEDLVFSQVDSKLMAKLTGLQETNIKRVSKEEFKKVIDNPTENVVLLWGRDLINPVNGSNYCWIDASLSHLQ